MLPGHLVLCAAVNMAVCIWVDLGPGFKDRPQSLRNGGDLLMLAETSGLLIVSRVAAQGCCGIERELEFDWNTTGNLWLL